MKKHWYYRWLLSYIPIYLILVSVLVLIFHITIYNTSKNQIMKSNEVYVNRVLQILDTSLRMTEQFLIKEILMDDNLKNFFEEDLSNKPYEVSVVANKLIELNATIPLIHSMFLYKESGQTVLSNNRFTPISDFEDREFIYSIYDQIPNRWTVPRDYQDLIIHKPESVVSIVKYMPIGSNKNGMIVANISVSSIKNLIAEMSDINLVMLHDSTGTPFFEETVSVKKISDQAIAQAFSEYTGWSVSTVINLEGAHSIFSMITEPWIIFGFIIVVGLIGLLTYITHAHYKPIANLTDMVQNSYFFQNNKNSSKGTYDEFKFIKSAFEGLMDQASINKLQQRENLSTMERQFIHELFEEGDMDSVSLEKWKVKLGISFEFNCSNVVILEIDKVSWFYNTYSVRDQQLFRFTIQNVFQEVARNAEAQVWCQWIERHRLVSVIKKSEKDEELENAVSIVCEVVRKWVEENMELRITVGIGTRFESFNHIVRSYEEAKEALKYKSFYGTNRLIGYWDIDKVEDGEVFDHLHNVKTIAQMFRLGQADWKNHYELLFENLQNYLFSRDEVVSLMNYMIYYLHKELLELSDDFMELWNVEAVNELNNAVENFETIEELYSMFYTLLNKLEILINKLRMNKTNYQIISETKKYIEENYTNADLSLNHLSEKFNLSSRYLSKLFKDIFGEKYVDYLAKIRVERSKDLLVETDDSVQEIALKLGYYHDISFIRIFKKIVGTTPGLYRKNHQKS